MKRLTLLLLLIASVSLGCKFLDSIRGGGGSGGPSIGGFGSDPKADVIAASRKFIELKSFSAKMEGVGQTEIKSQVDYVAPDRFHVKYLAGTAAGMEIVYIGSDGYMKTNDKWSKMPSSGQTIPNLRDSFTEEGLKTLTDAKYEGEETADGVPVWVYSYRNVTPVGAYPFRSTIYIKKDSGLPMKLFVEYSNGTLKNMVVVYDTETPVTIEPPIK